MSLALYIESMSSKSKVKIHNYWFILAAQIFLIFLGGFMEDRLGLYIIFTVSLLLVYGSIIRTIWMTRIARIMSLVVGLVAFISGFIWVIPGVSEETGFNYLGISTFSYAAFILIAIIAMSRFVFITDRVTTNRIVGSVCIYLLIGMFFTFVYAALGILVPGAFDIGGRTLGKMETFRDYLYYSYITLTTTGYGDMLPMSPITKMLAVVEAIVGPMYLAIMIARLIGMQISQEVRKAVR
jgi:hypothetical protein